MEPNITLTPAEIAREIVQRTSTGQKQSTGAWKAAVAHEAP
jgi:hypothetical protein